NYLEVVKDRLYNPDKRGQEAKESAQYALHVSLLGVLKMMAPIMPYITEELYQLYFRQHGKAKSIHLSEWPAPGMKDDEAEKAGDFFVEVLEKVRKAKSERKLSLKATVKSLEIKGAITERLFSDMKEDLMAATGAEKITFSVGKESSVSVGI
ncbi:TPA: class I tRNA ligase family protein, partial [Candidatus Woesearchaeota archaeon]|nr:class I tRNA ligase family protein [Candidatus Woesearchaeota archaeon]